MSTDSKKKYEPSEIEPRWQQQWRDDRLYEAERGGDKKLYVLTMLQDQRNVFAGDAPAAHLHLSVPADYNIGRVHLVHR